MGLICLLSLRGVRLRVRLLRLQSCTHLSFLGDLQLLVTLEGSPADTEISYPVMFHQRLQLKGNATSVTKNTVSLLVVGQTRSIAHVSFTFFRSASLTVASARSTSLLKVILIIVFFTLGPAASQHRLIHHCDAAKPNRHYFVENNDAVFEDARTSRFYNSLISMKTHHLTVQQLLQPERRIFKYQCRYFHLISMFFEYENNALSTVTRQQQICLATWGQWNRAVKLNMDTLLSKKLCCVELISNQRIYL